MHFFVLPPIIRGVQNSVMRNSHGRFPLLNKRLYLFLCFDDAEMAFEKKIGLQVLEVLPTNLDTVFHQTAIPNGSGRGCLARKG